LFACIFVAAAKEFAIVVTTPVFYQNTVLAMII